MKLTGKITDCKVLNGTRADGTPYQGAEYTITEQGVQYPQSCVFSVFGDKFLDWKIKPEQVGTVEISIQVRYAQSSGRKFNDVRVTGWEIGEATAPEQNTPAVAAPAPTKANLPF